MTLIWAFIVAGLFCVAGQIILDNTKLTPGHVTSLFTVLGSIMAFFGIYEKLIDLAGGGATTIISNFGYLLYTGALEAYHKTGFLGIFMGLLSKGGLAIVGAVIFGVLVSLFFKARD